MKRAIDSDTPGHRTGVAVGSDGRDIAQPFQGAPQYGDAGGMDAVVVGEKDLQGHVCILADEPESVRRTIDR